MQHPCKILKPDGRSKGDKGYTLSPSGSSCNYLVSMNKVAIHRGDGQVGRPLKVSLYGILGRGREFKPAAMTNNLKEPSAFWQTYPE